MSDHKAFFLGGASKSGKTQLRRMLGEHPQLGCIGGLKLMTFDLFEQFPEWYFKSSEKTQLQLISIFKQLCLTRFYAFRERMRGQRLWDLWWKVDKQWCRRFSEPGQGLWPALLGSGAEKIWLSTGIQQRSLASNQEWKRENGYCGLGFPDEGCGGISRQDIEKHFDILGKLQESKTLDEVYLVYGQFWDAIFTTMVSKQGKTHWMDEATAHAVSGVFWKKCFPHIKVIHMVRDGRDVALDRSAKYNLSPQLCLDRWARKMKKVRRDQAQLKPGEYMNLRYEDMIADPQKTLKSITDFLELPEMILSGAYSLKSDFVGRYRNHFSVELMEYSRQRHGKVLESWGYET